MELLPGGLTNVCQVKNEQLFLIIDMSFHVYTQALYSEAHLMWSLTGISYMISCSLYVYASLYISTC